MVGMATVALLIVMVVRLWRMGPSKSMVELNGCKNVDHLSMVISNFCALLILLMKDMLGDFWGFYNVIVTLLNNLISYYCSNRAS